MTGYISNAISDMRGGRQSWRVITFLSAPAFAISFGAVLLHLAG